MGYKFSQLSIERDLQQLERKYELQLQSGGGQRIQGIILGLKNVAQDAQDVAHVAQDVAQDDAQDDAHVAQVDDPLLRQILKIIRDNPKISRAEMAALCGKSAKTIERKLKENSNLVRYSGRGFSGRWEIIIAPKNVAHVAQDDAQSDAQDSEKFGEKFGETSGACCQ